MNEAYRNVVNRTSVRSFTEKEVESEKIELLLRAGMSAPSAMNKQPWEFIIVVERLMLDKLGDALPYAKMLFEAPLAIVVCGNLDKSLPGFESEYWVQDCACVAENILIAVNSLNLGAVWTGVYPDEIRTQNVRDLLKIPKHIIPLTIIPIGYPKIAHIPFDKWKVNKIHHDNW